MIVQNLEKNFQELRKIFRNLGLSNEEISIKLKELVSELKVDNDIKFVLTGKIDLKEI